MTECLKSIDKEKKECAKSEERRRKECTEKEQQRSRECLRSEDQGHKTCESYRVRRTKRCCTWPPCSWFCDAFVWVTSRVCISWIQVSKLVCVSWKNIVKTVCVSYAWVVEKVCVAWTYTTETICLLQDVGSAVIGTLVVIIESTIGMIIIGAGIVVEIIQAIPGIGSIIRVGLNLATHVIFGLVGLIYETVNLVLGIRPEKKLRICTIILRDEKGNPVARAEDVVAQLQLTADVFKRDANIRLLPGGPPKFSNSFSPPVIVDQSWVHVDQSPSPSNLLEPIGKVLPELGQTGSDFQLKLTSLCPYGAGRRLIGYGAPITIFIVRDTGPKSAGRSSLMGYAFVEGSTSTITDAKTGKRKSLRTIAHEAAHLCLLKHVCVIGNARNLMASTLACDDAIPKGVKINKNDPNLYGWQVFLMRTSKHVSNF